MKNLIKEMEKGWDSRTVEMLATWTKHFGDKMKICPDCGGWTTKICEKVMGDFFQTILNNFDRTTVAHTEKIVEGIRLEVEEMEREGGELAPYLEVVKTKNIDKMFDYAFEKARKDILSLLSSLTNEKCTHPNRQFHDGGGVSGSYLQCDDCRKIIK